MARSRGNSQAANEDNTRTSRRKTTASTAENLLSSSGQGSCEGNRAFYHCNYCNKDITGKTRIKCAVCPDFDLCIECFSVGAEVTPHKTHHPYRIMNDLSFPVFCLNWDAQEEMSLLEGIEMYGLENWAEVAVHVGTKTKEECVEHYRNVYLNSPNFVPDMSGVNRENKNEQV
ncbi:hypothetical protein SLEP1_g19108 [Rubroshorea leprosula]|nr:hypothetical protein SLEP1_g19108 [Rubroshorea leprosula]